MAKRQELPPLLEIQVRRALAERDFAEGWVQATMSAAKNAAPDQQGEVEQLGMFMEVACRTLSPRELLALQLRYVLEMTPSEIAAELGVSRSTARNVLSKALEKLRRPSFIGDLLKQFMPGADTVEIEAHLNLRIRRTVFSGAKPKSK
jgi:RNA polymerase sigma factor (sigma-70 family)